MKVRRPLLHLVALVIVALASLFAVGYLFGDRHFVDSQLHSTGEALGAFAAVAMSMVLAYRRNGEYGGRYFLLSLGFLGMGVLDGLHAISPFGAWFVFFHSLAALVGGFWFALVWLPSAWIDRILGHGNWIRWAALSMVVPFLVFARFGEMLPLVQGEAFAPATVGLDVLAGLLFLAAAVRLTLDYLKLKDPEIYRLAAVAFLFAWAGGAHMYSSVWTGVWWYWHVVRLSAFFLVFGLLFNGFRQTMAELRRSHEELERRVQERTVELALKSRLLDNAKDSVLVHDMGGNFVYVNEAAYKDRGYTKEEFLSLSLGKILVPEEAAKFRDRCALLQAIGSNIFESAHFKKDGTVMDVEVHASRLKHEGRDLVISVVRDATERKRAKELSDALNEINQAINSTLEINQVLQRAIVDAGEAIGCRAAAIVLREADHWVYGQSSRLPGARPGLRLTEKEAKRSLPSVSTRTLFVSNDVLHDDRLDRDIMVNCGFRSFLSVPLILKEEVLGVLNFYHQSAPVVFTEAQMDFAAKLGACLALALENARLYLQEHNIAVTLQESLLVMPEQILGIDFGHRYRSATTETAVVGGDFYDLFELEGDRVGIVIGDVSGKGLAAATLTSLVKNTIRAYAYKDGSPPSVMADTNRVVSNVSPESMFVTVFFGILDKKSGRLVYCNAGHPEPLVKKRGAELEHLPVSSPAIGLFSIFDYVGGEAKLEPGDALVLYTDGVIEARREKEFFTQERLRDIVQDIDPAIHVGEFPERILGEVGEFTGGQYRDDTALMALWLAD